MRSVDVVRFGPMSFLSLYVPVDELMHENTRRFYHQGKTAVLANEPKDEDILSYISGLPDELLKEKVNVCYNDIGFIDGTVRNLLNDRIVDAITHTMLDRSANQWRHHSYDEVKAMVAGSCATKVFREIASKIGEDAYNMKSSNYPLVKIEGKFLKVADDNGGSNHGRSSFEIKQYIMEEHRHMDQCLDRGFVVEYDNMKLTDRKIISGSGTVDFANKFYE
ncbi:hypothetical protein GOV11_01555 [Candidatus Woesearchaeota archaeon]|nr:hypothetical protein [Candidatus Woesearchaeota archaeon]